MTHEEIAKQIKNAKENIFLVYAFNSTGKTRLSVAYKDATKNKDGSHAGVYYNAFSEDIFVWDNDTQNNEENIRLQVRQSSLNTFHGLITENAIREKLTPYNPRYDFFLNPYEDTEKGIEYITFFKKGDEDNPIKISRGEERIFVWCFFLALFEVEGWADQQNGHFFIDDPVSSLDDHNIFITASTIFDLIEKYFESRKLIITTHHIGLFAILYDWLKKGEKSGKYKESTRATILNLEEDSLSLKGTEKDVFLYHLHLLQILKRARSTELKAFHFALLRQVLESVASFLGVGRVGYVLEILGFDPEERVSEIVNFLSHKNVYRFESDVVVPDNKKLFEDIFDRLQKQFPFVVHVKEKLAPPATAEAVPKKTKSRKTAKKVLSKTSTKKTAAAKPKS